MQNNEELASKNETISIKHDNNPFTFNGSLSRGGFLLNLFLNVFFITIFLCLSLVILKFSPDEIIAKRIVRIIQTSCTAISLCIITIAYAKRLYDIIHDKRKSIFYTIACVILKTSFHYISWLAFLVKPFSFVILMLLLFYPGKKQIHS